MKLTDTEKNELLHRFYIEKLIPLAEKHRASNRDFFPLKPDKNAESYYKDRNDDGNYIHEVDYSDLEGELRELWKGDLDELGELAAPLVELARLLEEREETDADVSPFIYAMF